VNLQAKTKSRSRQTFCAASGYWAVAFTFFWGFIVATLGLKEISGWNEWIIAFIYPVMCVSAALYLMRVRKSGSFIFALVNVAFGMAWVIFVIWASRAFARSFWK